MNAKSDNLSYDEQQSDVQRAITGAEKLLNDATSATGEKAAELRSKALAQLAALRERAAAAQEVAIEKSKYAARVTDDYVHENPWRVIGGAIAIGLAIGLLVNSRR